MNTALTMTTAAQTIEAQTDAIALMNTARDLAETLNTTLGELEGKPKNDVGSALAAILQAVAKRIES
jgi:hypothetical protein